MKGIVFPHIRREKEEYELECNYSFQDGWLCH